MVVAWGSINLSVLVFLLSPALVRAFLLSRVFFYQGMVYWSWDTFVFRYQGYVVTIYLLLATLEIVAIHCHHRHRFYHSHACCFIQHASPHYCCVAGVGNINEPILQSREFVPFQAVNPTHGGWGLGGMGGSSKKAGEYNEQVTARLPFVSLLECSCGLQNVMSPGGSS